MDDANEEKRQMVAEKRLLWFAWFGATVFTPLVKRTRQAALYNAHLSLEDHVIRVKALPRDETAWEDLYEHVWRRYRLQKDMYRSGLEPEMERRLDDVFRSLRMTWSVEKMEDLVLLIRQACRVARTMMPKNQEPIELPEDLFGQMLLLDTTASETI